MVLLLSPGCAPKAAIRTPTTATKSPADNSYMDLTPGWRLRILVPVLNSGGSQVALGSARTNGNTIVLSAANLLGYELSYYSVEGKGDGRVRLRFTTAEKTIDGKTVPEPNAPKLPFPLPAKSEYIRLIYLVRKSQSDHNMAITASKNLNALNVFTEKLKDNSDICKRNGEISCIWVPSGIAVRPEPLSPSSN